VPKPLLAVRLPNRTVVSEHAAEALVGRITAREQAPERSGVQTLDPRLVARKGRIKADGSRTGARVRRKVTAYIPPELGRRLDVHAASLGLERSEVLAEALAAHLDARKA